MSQTHLSTFSLFFRSIASSLAMFFQYLPCHSIVLFLVALLPVPPVVAAAALSRVPTPPFAFLPLSHFLCPDPALYFSLPDDLCLGLSIISNLTISFPELVQGFSRASMKQKRVSLRTVNNTASVIGRKKKRLGKNEPAAPAVA